MADLFLFHIFEEVKDIVVIGGGLAGLINAILLNRAGLTVSLIEEKKYPFHRVCGEYISNEVIPFLKKNQLFPGELSPSKLTEFHLSSITGKSLKMPLDLGGFGISRYAFDAWLVDIARKEGVEIINDRVIESNFIDDSFLLKGKSDNEYEAKLVIGAFGKRSLLDRELERPFFQKKSPYVGVKYHIQTNEVPGDVIALHNFKGGYCGVSKIENDTFNLCYLSHRSNLKHHGSIEEMEASTLSQNPFLKSLLENATFLLDKPEVINEITFEKKEPVFNHILMSGDSAGMITPLCGNGMAMAIHSAQTLSHLVIENMRKGFNRSHLEGEYTRQWDALFANRLKAGRAIQKLFGSPGFSELAVRTARSIPPISRFLMKKTHGQPF